MGPRDPGSIPKAAHRSSGATPLALPPEQLAQTRFQIFGLKSGTPVRVLFDDRTLGLMGEALFTTFVDQTCTNATAANKKAMAPNRWL